MTDITKTEQVTALSDIFILLPEELRSTNRKVNLQTDDRQKLDALEQKVVKGFKRVALHETASQMSSTFSSIAAGDQYKKALSELAQAQQILLSGGKLTDAHNLARTGQYRLSKLFKDFDPESPYRKALSHYSRGLFECRPHAMPREFSLKTFPMKVKYVVDDFDYGGKADGKSQFDLLERCVEKPAVGYIRVVSPDVAPAAKLLARMREELNPVKEKYVTIFDVSPRQYFQPSTVKAKVAYK